MNIADLFGIVSGFTAGKQRGYNTAEENRLKREKTNLEIQELERGLQPIGKAFGIPTPEEYEQKETEFLTPQFDVQYQAIKEGKTGEDIPEGKSFKTYIENKRNLLGGMPEELPLKTFQEQQLLETKQRVPIWVNPLNQNETSMSQKEGWNMFYVSPYKTSIQPKPEKPPKKIILMSEFLSGKREGKNYLSTEYQIINDLQGGSQGDILAKQLFKMAVAKLQQERSKGAISEGTIDEVNMLGSLYGYTAQTIEEEITKDPNWFQKLVGYTPSPEKTTKTVVAPTRESPKPKSKPESLKDRQRIKVRDINSGKTGTIEYWEFDSNKYEKI